MTLKTLTPLSPSPPKKTTTNNQKKLLPFHLPTPPPKKKRRKKTNTIQCRCAAHGVGDLHMFRPLGQAKSLMDPGAHSRHDLFEWLFGSWLRICCRFLVVFWWFFGVFVLVLWEFEWIFVLFFDCLLRDFVVV